MHVNFNSQDSQIKISNSSESSVRNEHAAKIADAGAATQEVDQLKAGQLDANAALFSRLAEVAR